MEKKSLWYRWDNHDLLIRVRVQPRACRDEFTDIQQGYLRVRITAPPVDGKANTHLRKLLSKVFRVANAKVTLISGETSRVKRLRISTPGYLPLDINPPPNGPST
jgi:uncharacterized protein (TIGR00251 family)